MGRAGFNPQCRVSEEGELLTFRLTPGHGDDRQPGPRLVQSPRSIQRECLEQVLVLAVWHPQRLRMNSGVSYYRWRTLWRTPWTVRSLAQPSC